MHPRSPGLARMAEELQRRPHSPCSIDYASHLDLPGLRTKSRSKPTLRRFCTDILPPDTVSKDPRTTSLINAVESKLANTFKRHAPAKWAKRTEDRCPRLADITSRVESTVSRRCTSSTTTSSSSSSIERASKEYASFKNSTSRSTLVDSLISTGTESSHISTQSLGQQTLVMHGLTRTPYNSNTSNTSSYTSHAAATHEPALRVEPRHRLRLVESDQPASGLIESAENKSTEQRFLLRRHSRFADVMEVISCRGANVAYRRILHGGKLWCTSFHSADDSVDGQVGPRPPATTCGYIGLSIQGSDTASFQAEFPSSLTGCFGNMSPRIPSPSFNGQPQFIHQPSFADQLSSLSFAPTSFASEASSGHLQPQQLHRPRLHQQAWSRYPRAFERNRLWEISSPRPGVFPLHCRDTRGVLDPVPLTPMVLDRHQFCYRFYLSGNKMRWQARKQGHSTVELQCFVRNSVVALLLFGGHGPADAPRPAEARWPWRNKGRRSDYPPATGGPADKLPSIVILPAAFSKLAAVDPAIVKSFVLFTGIEVLECFLYAA